MKTVTGSIATMNVVFAFISMSASTQLAPVVAAQELPPIREVSIGRQREFVVNSKPFLPIMGWLQGPQNLPKLKAVGINTVAGYWWEENKNEGAGGTKNASEYADLARKAGLYFIAPYMEQHPAAMKTLAGPGNLLAWIHGDEPDLPDTISEAEVVPAPGLAINNSTPLWKLLDGDKFSWSVLDPLDGAGFSIKLKQPATVRSLAVWLTVSPGLPVAKEIVFSSAGQEILRAPLENNKGQQKFDLPAPATFKELSVKILSSYPDKNKWGSISEIEAFDDQGRDVLLSTPRKVSRQTAEQVKAHYETIKAFDPMRPVLMTVSGFFINDDVMHNWWTKEQSDALYPALLQWADVPGFDIYPIYGWNRSDKLNWVSQGSQELSAYAGRRKPFYVWIETQAGGDFGDKAQPVSGVEIRNEVYQAIINGATAIGYFTHQFKPTFSEFGVPQENQKALLEINQQLQSLAPIILSADAKVQPKITIEGEVASQCLAKEYEGQLYLFAQNLDVGHKAGKATVAIDGLKAGTAVEVVDEKRTITAATNGFSDDFAPLAVHIYRLKTG